MEQLLIYAIITMLAAYGFAVLIKEFVCSRKIKGVDGLKLAILVKNRERDIEWVIRRAVSERGILFEKSKPPIAVVDLNSSDETAVMLETLVSEYDDLELITYNNRNKLFEG